MTGQLEPEIDSLGLLEGNIFEKLCLKGEEEDDAILDAVLIDSPHFCPMTYLKLIHKEASYDDLKLGLGRLKEKIVLEELSLKSVLKGNFDRFVNAKSTVDSKEDAYKLSFFLTCFLSWCRRV